MKRIISIFLSALLLLSLFMVSGCKDSEDKTIVVYNWGGPYMAEGSGGSVDINKIFEERYGIKVVYRTFDSNESMYTKIKNGGASYDVIFPSDYMVARLIEEGLVEKLDFSNIPLFEKNVMDNFKNPNYDPKNEYSVPYTWGTVGIVYNTKMVKEPVDSWSIFWDEKYKDDVLMFNNSRDAFAIAEILLGYSLNTTNKAEIRAATEKLKEQKSVLQSYCMDEIYEKMISENAAIAPYYAGDALIMIEENPDLAFALPKEGTNSFVDAICIPKGSRHKKEAELYINFLLEAEIGLENCDATGYGTPNKATYELLDDEMKNDPIMYPDDEYLKKCESYIHLPAETNKFVQDCWIDIKIH